jgi:bifunctional DNA-binding transcriptional regulator/antitoxin component of YhaV-PrlF toxin-antitoxin module
MLIGKEVKINRKGQIKIPKEIMKKAELKPKVSLYVFFDEDSEVFAITEGIEKIFELLPQYARNEEEEEEEA